MKKSISFSGIILLIMALTVTSCKKDDNATPADKTVVVSLITKNNVITDHWVYYSFETKAEVSGIDSSNYQTSDKWDIAFHSRHVRLNGGTSGNGLAEAYDAGVVDWESVTKAPESGYVKDAFAEDILYAGNGPQGPIMVGTNLNMAFETAFSFDANTHPPTYNANKNVYLIRTRTGNYAKIMLTDYYNDLGDSGYITFKYVLNEEGGLDF